MSKLSSCSVSVLEYLSIVGLVLRTSLNTWWKEMLTHLLRIIDYHVLIFSLYQVNILYRLTFKSGVALYFSQRSQQCYNCQYNVNNVQCYSCQMTILST